MKYSKENKRITIIKKGSFYKVYVDGKYVSQLTHEQIEIVKNTIKSINHEMEHTVPTA